MKEQEDHRVGEPHEELQHGQHDDKTDAGQRDDRAEPAGWATAGASVASSDMDTFDLGEANLQYWKVNIHPDEAAAGGTFGYDFPWAATDRAKGTVRPVLGTGRRETPERRPADS